ncbi:MAG: hypothetical protein K2W88_00115 [Pararheinheimera sp.]|nr:hypothetical protein [Rheinheimera sp.]
MTRYYGVVSYFQLRDIARAVCNVIGFGANHNADVMLLKTCAAETNFGTFKDPTPDGAGRGVAQVDEGTFLWLRGKYGSHKLGELIRQAFDVDIRRVNHDDLDYNPLLCCIFARLKYWTITEPIPTDEYEQAEYWKEHYNSAAGGGSPEHFVKQVKTHLETIDAYRADYAA